MDEEQKLQGSPANEYAGGQEEQAGNNNSIEILKLVTQMKGLKCPSHSHRSIRSNTKHVPCPQLDFKKLLLNFNVSWDRNKEANVIRDLGCHPTKL